MKIDVSTQNGCNGRTILERRHVSARATIKNSGNLKYNLQDSDGNMIRLAAGFVFVATFAYIAFSIMSKTHCIGFL